MMILALVSGFLFGAALGSFTKATADRTLGRKTLWGRSYCPFCKTELRWYDLFPVVSYILLKARCRKCHKKIPIEYLVVEVVTGALIAYLFYVSFLRLQAIGFSIDPLLSPKTYIMANFQFSIFLIDLILKIFFICVLVAVTITDIRKMLIPDRIILPSIIVSFFGILILTIDRIAYLYFSLSQSQIGKYLLPPHSDYFQRNAFIIGQSFLGSLLSGLAIGGFFYLLIVITKGKGMGGGDVKLGAFMGLILGFPNAFVALILSFLTGATYSIFLLITGKKKLKQAIPFGPFLVLGSLIVLFWGDKILDWYLKLSF